MKKEKLQEKWQGISEDLIVGMSEWRERHPRASMREIEEEIDKRLSEMRARMIADTAMNSASATTLVRAQRRFHNVATKSRREGVCWSDAIPTLKDLLNLLRGES